MARPDSPRLFHLPKAWHAQCPLGSTFQPHRVCVRRPDSAVGQKPSVDVVVGWVFFLHWNASSFTSWHPQVECRSLPNPRSASIVSLRSRECHHPALSCGCWPLGNLSSEAPLFWILLFFRLARVYLVFFPKCEFVFILWSALFRLFRLKIMFVPLHQLAQRVYD